MMQLEPFFQIEDYILGLDDGKKRFVRNVKALMMALDLSITSEEAKYIREDAALFQSISRSLVKTETEVGMGGRLDESRYVRNGIDVDCP